MEDQIILVDENDKEIGSAGKLDAHKSGKLHRALSVFIFHPDGRMLMQKRAAQKYHSGGLWSNSCCSHPRLGEDTLAAAHRRLKEEMAIDCELKHIYEFMYRTEFDNGLIENEYDHVYIGESSATPVVDPAEAEEWKWADLSEIRVDIQIHPERYTYWLKLVLEDVLMKAGRI